MRERPGTWLPRWSWRWVVPGLACFVVVLLLPGLISRLRRTHCEAARADVAAILGTLNEYAISNSGRFPNTLQALLAPIEGRILIDPWGREYHYEPPTPERIHPRVWSLGADGILGGTGENADIDSDQLREMDG